MKNLATGLLTVLCATAFSFAQSYDQPNEQTYDQNYGQADYTQTAPNAAEAPAYAGTQVEQNTEVQQPTTEQTNANATNDNVANASIENNDPMPIDELVPVKKKAPFSIGVNATFIYGYFWGFENLSDYGYENPTGFGGEFGIAGRFTMAEGLQFSPEISFRIFNVNHKDGDDEESEEYCYNQMFIDIALYLRGVLGNGFFLEIAPQIAINTSAEYTSNGSEKDYKTFNNVEQSVAEFGLNVGAGYFILDNLSVSFRWYMGFNEIFPDIKTYEEVFEAESLDENGNIKKGIKYSQINLKGAHTMMFKFGVTYWFI
ncbi:MAG: PorT family protein [Fibrobacter sp.]|nr:PorT family protein [Fibrobacter sp.]